MKRNWSVIPTGLGCILSVRWYMAVKISTFFKAYYQMLILITNLFYAETHEHVAPSSSPLSPQVIA